MPSEPLNDLDRLAAQLSDDTAIQRVTSGGLTGWFQMMAQRNASDLILLAGEPPTFRIEGRVVRSHGEVLDGDDVLAMVSPSLPAHAQRAFREVGIADAAVKVAGLGRFRVNLHRERGRPAANIRRLPVRIPAMA